jgi:hypothetical protein
LSHLAAQQQVDPPQLGLQLPQAEVSLSGCTTVRAFPSIAADNEGKSRPGTVVALLETACPAVERHCLRTAMLPQPFTPGDQQVAKLAQ